MCEKKREGKKRDAAKSERPSEWSLTPKLLNRRPKMATVRKLKKTLMSPHEHSSSQLKKPAGAGVLTRAAKRRLEETTPSTTAAVKLPRRADATVSSQPDNVISQQSNQRDSSKIPNKEMSKFGDGPTISNTASTSNEDNAANDFAQKQCDFKPDTLIIGAKSCHC